MEYASASSDGTPRYTLVYAIALESTGQRPAAIEVLEEGLEKHGENAELRNAYLHFKQQP